jgi:hypothetical protein
MKALVTYDDKSYLVPIENDRVIDYNWLFDLVNSGRYPDECHYKEWIVQRSKVIAFFTDESQLIS